jgi:hypothetical protein
MGGKAAILLVLGFSMIFLVFTQNNSRVSTTATQNFADYYTETKVNNMAQAAANMAAHKIFENNSWSTGFPETDFDGGTMQVSVATAGSLKIISSTATFNGKSKTIKVKLKREDYSKYGNFYGKVSAIPATGDTFRGPFHVNSDLKTYGDPVFMGKVTMKGNLIKLGPTKNPEFMEGYDKGVDKPVDFDTSGMRTFASTNGLVLKDTSGSGNKIEVKMKLKGSGDVEYSYRIFDGSPTWSSSKTVPLSTLTPNGVVYVEHGDVFIKGTLNGRLTVVASTQGKSDGGNIYQTDDLVYNDDPTVDQTVDDMLGLVAEKNIRLQYNNDTKHHDIITQASMFAKNGNIGPDNALVNNDGVLSRWKILGGLIAKDIRVTAKYSWSTGKPYKGYQFVHTYDERFKIKSPPHFPQLKYEVVSWFE